MALIEVKYFNSFLLRKSVDSSNQPQWFGSRGIPQVVGGWEQGAVDANNTLNWAIEESRIRGGYNNTSTSLGAKAYLVEDEPEGSIRGNSMIYSGIFNSRTGINQTNQFPVGSEITKSTDPSDGSIQRLYAEDTNLIIFSEKKVSRALIDKDAIYTAEGGGVPVSQLNLVIGQIIPYAGNYGIADNPESFAVYGYRKYFVDKNRNAVLRLSRDGITEISNYGMIDWFRDNLSAVDSTSFGAGKIIGGWDIYTKQYTVSLQQNDAAPESTYHTLQFDEKILGWPSFYTFKPRFMFSLANRFYSISNEGSTQDNVWVHNDLNTNRANFYSIQGKSNIRVDSIEVDSFGQPVWLLPPETRDTTNSILSYYEGEYIINPLQASPTFGTPVYRPDYVTVFGSDDPPYNKEYAGFVRKENKYYANLVNNSSATAGEVRFGEEMTGIKAYYCTVTIENDDYTNIGGAKELFAVNSTFVQSS